MSNKDERFLEAIAENIDCDCGEIEYCLLCKIHHIAASTLNSVAEEMDYAVKQIKEAISITRSTVKKAAKP